MECYDYRCRRKAFSARLWVYFAAYNDTLAWSRAIDITGCDRHECELQKCDEDYKFWMDC